MWSTHTVEYYLTVKKGKNHEISGKWRELENIPNEVPQTQKDAVCLVWSVGVSLESLDVSV